MNADAGSGSVTVGFGSPSAAWHDFIKDDPPLAAGATTGIDRLVIFGGGFPITVDGAVVGGIGVSGGHYSEDSDVAELRITEAVLREVPKLERFQAFLRLCVAAGPLLGLIGTVVGMILTFQSITESGSSDPKLMANGIGVAMIATVLGLFVAISLLFANALLNSLSRGVVQILDEQSAGMLAESIEKQKRA